MPLLLLAILTSVTLGVQVPAASGGVTSLTVTHAARAVAPGEVALLTISAPVPISTVRGTAFGHPLAVFPGETAGTWYALVGIDLDTAPGDHPVSIEAAPPGGPTESTIYHLTVEPKTFGLRRLRVAQQFVTPPPSALRRIEREQQLLSRVFSAVSLERLWHGAFEQPVDAVPSSRFGVRSVYNGKTGNPHRGTDFASPAGAPIRAPNAGRVVLAEELYYSGNTVVVDHGLGLFSLVAHLSRIDVRQGDLVARGATVGAVGATGRVTGPHLHWSVRVAGASVDPLSLLALAATLASTPTSSNPPSRRLPLATPATPSRSH